MHTESAENILQCIAAKHHSSVEEVREKIKKSILAAMNSKDPQVQAWWRALFPDGRIPTPEEFIAVMSVILGMAK